MSPGRGSLEVADLDDDDEEDDPRIAKLKSYAQKHTVADTIEILTSKVGAKEAFKPAVIGGTMCFSANSVMAYLLGEALKRIKGKIVHAKLEQISPFAVPVMLEMGKEPVFSGDAAEAILREAEDDLVRDAMS